MGPRHWDEDELIARLYGLGPGDGHLEECEYCAERWRSLVAARQRVLEQPLVPETLLLAQRDAIERRTEARQRSHGWLPFAFATALGAVILLAVTLYRPAPVTEQSDSEFFAEVYSMVGSSEPLAIEPIHALFEVEP